MSVTVRAAEREDVPEIARVNIDSWRAAYRGLISKRYLEHLDRGARERTWRERIIGNPMMPTLVALDDGALVGYCAVALPSRDEDAGPDVAEIAAIYVDPAYWRGGTGRALMEAALRRIREDGSAWRTVTLWMLAANDRAHAFYSSFGFKADGSRHHLLDLRADEIRLRLELEAA